MNIKGKWAGAISCFLLFTVVCMSLAFNVKGHSEPPGIRNWDCSFHSAAWPRVFSREGEVVKPLLGAMLAAPLCLVLMRLLFVSTRSLWQELAAAEWRILVRARCAVFLFLRTLIRHQRLHNKRMRTPLRPHCVLITAARFRRAIAPSLARMLFIRRSPSGINSICAYMPLPQILSLNTVLCTVCPVFQSIPTTFHPPLWR